MTRQNQYYNLMKMIQRDGMIDTNNWQKEYIWQYHEPIQIGTRLGDLCRSGYLTSTTIWKWRNVWTLTQKGIDWNGEELIIKQYPKVKKTRAESEVKQEAKTYTEKYKEMHEKIVNNNWPLREKEAPPIDSEYMNWKHIYSISDPVNLKSWDRIIVTMKEWKIVQIDTNVQRLDENKTIKKPRYKSLFTRW